MGPIWVSMGWNGTSRSQLIDPSENSPRRFVRVWRSSEGVFEQTTTSCSSRSPTSTRGPKGSTRLGPEVHGFQGLQRTSPRSASRRDPRHLRDELLAGVEDEARSRSVLENSERRRHREYGSGRSLDSAILRDRQYASSVPGNPKSSSRLASLRPLVLAACCRRERSRSQGWAAATARYPRQGTQERSRRRST